MFDPVLPLAHLNQRVRVNARVLGPSDAHKSALHPCSASGRATSLMWGAHTPTRAAGNVHGRGLITVVRAQVAIIDQIICSLAVKFIGTRESFFTGIIEEEIAHKQGATVNKLPEKHYFTADD